MNTTPETTDTTQNQAKSMEELVALCKRRGFIFQASEIYGGLNGFWDYGPLGTELKNNLRDAWWQDMVKSPPMGPDGQPVSILGVDSAIVQHPKVWEASGHVAGFNDPMVDCKACKARFRADQLGEYQCPMKPSKKVGDHDKCDLTEPRQFNLMFKTFVGATSGEDNVAYLRPETAQGIFLNYKNVLDTMRVKMPFGIAQIGKAFRNEVTPRNFIFRSREFEQMEIEFFCAPEEKQMWYEFWCATREKWWKSIGLTDANLQMRQHDNDELAHYAKEGCGCFDVEYRFPFSFPGYGELEGVADRTDYDLKKHQEHSGSKLEYFDQQENVRYLPHVIEPSAGLSRGVLAVLCEAFTPTPDRKGSKWVMNFHPRLAPIKAAIFPLVAKEGMPEVARKLYDDLRTQYAVQYDVKQSIGKRYARMDEAGTPFCFTIDGDTLTDQTVTVRDRDSAGQDRIALDQVKTFLADRIGE
jgi:glycyl-tRNA synthetase